MFDVYACFVKMLSRLRRDESGIALMLTLSVFLLLYVVCAGIYSIGETVRQKIEVQNACDSAAYSAAVAQADGLSRMAMVNRALSWSYIQLTNMQMDYIIYKWLQLVSRRFHEDEEKCRKHNKESIFVGSIICPDCTKLDNWYVGPNKGWFCGKIGLQSLWGGGMGQLDVNGRTMSIGDIDGAIVQFKDVLKYGERVGVDDGEYIQQFKHLIATLNLTLPALNQEMQNAIYTAASSVLLENLPPEIRSKMNSEMSLTDPNDISRGRDYFWYVKTGAPINPYTETTDNALNGEGLYFNPLRNTELDERLFLSMADGAVYDNLVDYFYSPSGLNTHGRAGGLDQWFVRSYSDESADYWSKRIIPENNVEKAYRNLGICRVYKNSNRSDGGEVLRGHHTAITPLTDHSPSCLHKRTNCPDQCGSVTDNTAGLYADYEWGSIQLVTFCWLEVKQIGRITVPYKMHHTQTGIPLLKCNHICCSGSCFSDNTEHSRSGYTGSCFRDEVMYGGAVLAATAQKTSPAFLPYLPGYHPHYDLVARMKPTIYGFSRTYGDDRECYNQDTHTGVVAMPWILNERFYGHEGAIVVGLAKRLRNPWVWLLNAVVPYERIHESGIYSAFDPTGAECAVTAFSVARAAHRYTPSPTNMKCRSDLGFPRYQESGKMEYETRYDAVCADKDGDLDHEHPRITIRPGNGDSDLAKLRVGCVCGKENAKRFANCWNLCETDWDATLLPVRYAWSDTTSHFDSLVHPDGEDPSLVWQTVDEQNNSAEDYEDVPGNILYTAALEMWSPFWDEEGNMVFERDADDTRHLKAPVFLRRFNLNELLKAKYL